MWVIYVRFYLFIYMWLQSYQKLNSLCSQFSNKVKTINTMQVMFVSAFWFAASIFI